MARGSSAQPQCATTSPPVLLRVAAAHGTASPPLVSRDASAGARTVNMGLPRRVAATHDTASPPLMLWATAPAGRGYGHGGLPGCRQGWWGADGERACFPCLGTWRRRRLPSYPFSWPADGHGAWRCLPSHPVPGRVCGVMPWRRHSARPRREGGGAGSKTSNSRARCRSGAGSSGQ